ncbi:MAG: hypothetical protein U0835_26745 [Isosphaeraceae bacterium]
MDSHLTFPQLVLGPLAVCLSLLALSVVLRLPVRRLRPEAGVACVCDGPEAGVPRCHIDIAGAAEAGTTRLGGCRNG